jgi:hypothetical protein
MESIDMKTHATKPRNPLVAAALLRKAGVHRRSASGVRHRRRMALQHELRAEPLDKD